MHPNPNIVALALNPDVDALIIGVVGLGGVVHRRVRHATSVPPTAAQTVKLVRRLLEELRPELDQYSVVGMGLAIPGLVRAADGRVTLAPHLGWRDEPAEKIEDTTGYSTFAGNDANVGMIAETLFGAGQGVSDSVYLNGSTSRHFGAGVLVEGRASVVPGASPPSSGTRSSTPEAQRATAASGGAWRRRLTWRGCSRSSARNRSMPTSSTSPSLELLAGRFAKKCSARSTCSAKRLPASCPCSIRRWCSSVAFSGRSTGQCPSGFESGSSSCA